MHVLKTFDNACTLYGEYLSIRLALLLLYKKMFRPFQLSVKVRVISWDKISDTTYSLFHLVLKWHQNFRVAHPLAINFGK